MPCGSGGASTPAPSPLSGITGRGASALGSKVPQQDGVPRAHSGDFRDLASLTDFLPPTAASWDHPLNILLVAFSSFSQVLRWKGEAWLPGVCLPLTSSAPLTLVSLLAIQQLHAGFASCF